MMSTGPVSWGLSMAACGACKDVYVCMYIYACACVCLGVCACACVCVCVGVYGGWDVLGEVDRMHRKIERERMIK